eukprot:4535680-Pyramimonas_sp.AAC.1
MLSSTKYLLAGQQKTTTENLALGAPFGIHLNPDWGPVRYGPWAPAGATWRVRVGVGRRVPAMVFFKAMNGRCILDCCVRRGN